MAVKICGVEAKSIAQRHGICAGETLVSINGHEINDILDFRFYETNTTLTLLLQEADDTKRKITLRKAQYSSLGLEFETYLMDQQRRCRNNCIFCFIDQLPKGMRESLYFKDDDDRLSFLFGNYITLTNISQKEIDRILSMHISPINISVHTTNPELRVRMMRNRFAGESLKYLEQLAKGGARLNCQLVLCPGINDGAELERSMHDLEKLYPSVESVAAVPVGLTRFREGLAELQPFNRDTAAAVIDAIEAFGARCREKHGTRLFYAADEFYLKAERPLPPEEEYDGYPQLENGVGAITLLRGQFADALESITKADCPKKREISLASGVSAAPIIAKLLDALREKCDNFEYHLYAVKNDFFGHMINVAGLVTGGDILAQLSGKPLGEELLIPAVMLRHEQDMFLDDVTVEELSAGLKVPIRIIGEDGADLLDGALGL